MMRESSFHSPPPSIAHSNYGKTGRRSGKRKAETGKLNTCQRALAGQPAEGSPKGDMSGREHPRDSAYPKGSRFGIISRANGGAKNSDGECEGWDRFHFRHDGNGSES